jgi:uncharacterized membrane protein
MKETPALFLAVAYWLHMLATVAWLGGLAALALIVIPAAHKSLDADAYGIFLGRVQQRLQQVGWLCLVTLGATGMFQMSASPNYHGLLAITNTWAVAILSKHIAVLLMVVVSAYSTWGLMPAMRRMALLRSAGRAVPQAETSRLASRELLLLRLNLVLSLLVLALTAWARSS